MGLAPSRDLAEKVRPRLASPKARRALTALRPPADRCAGALVADAHLPSGVAGIRGLGRAGIEVTAVGPHRAAAGLWSRYARHRAVVACPDTDSAGFVTQASARLSGHGAVVAYPSSERSIDALIGLASAAPDRAQLPFPPGRSLSELRDKRALARLAERVGLAVPTLWQGRVRDLTTASVDLPAIVKSRGDLGGCSPAAVVSSPAELESVAASMAGEQEVLVQPYLRGALMMVALVIDREGLVVGRFAQLAERTWPREAGTASLVKSVSPPEALVDAAAEVLTGVGYFGLAQLDFLLTESGPRLLDVNPRFYASLPLALACDVNLPAAWHAVVVGERPPAERRYPLGATYRSLEATLSSGAVRATQHLRRKP